MQIHVSNLQDQNFYPKFKEKINSDCLTMKKTQEVTTGGCQLPNYPGVAT